MSEGAAATVAEELHQKLGVADTAADAAPAAQPSASEDAPSTSTSAAAAPHPSGLSLEERFSLVRGIAEECINDEELLRLLQNKPVPVAYDGFEPSGRMHIAQGVMKAINVNKLTKGGCHFKFWVADWFAQLNNKMGGDLKKIQTVGKYMVEVWKAVGMDLSKVRCGAGARGWMGRLRRRGGPSPLVDVQAVACTSGIGHIPCMRTRTGRACIMNSLFMATHRSRR